MGNRLTTILLLILLYVLFPAGVSMAEKPPVQGGLQVTLDRESAALGDDVVLTLNYHLPQGATLPANPDIGGLEGLTLISRSPGPDGDITQEETGTTGRMTMKFLVDQLDSWKTGPISITYEDNEGKAKSLTADPVRLKVGSNLGGKPEEAGLRPIQGIMPIKSLWVKYLPWAAGVLVVIIILIALFKWYKRHKHRQVPIGAQDLPHIWARTQIEDLKAGRVFEEGRVKEFYFRLSGILRQYLEAIREFPAAEYTTQEIAVCIRNDQDRELLPLLRQADLIKFADTVPTVARKEEDIEKALTYIKKTGPVPEPGTSPGDVKGEAR